MDGFEFTENVAFAKEELGHERADLYVDGSAEGECRLSGVQPGRANVGSPVLISVIHCST